jgi:hypothetical protein
LLHYTRREQYIARLADDGAALILVDGSGGGEGAGWRFWTTTPKTSPATRRIPILLIHQDESPNAPLNVEGLMAGADLVLSADALMRGLDDYLRDFARVQDAAAATQLARECHETLPPLAREGVEKFNAREFYRQHDLFEALWVQTETPVRDLYRAILQVGVAYYQITRGNARGAQKMLLRSVQWLALLPDECQGIDVAQLKSDAHAVRTALDRLGEARIHEFDQALLKPLVFTEQ